MGILDFFALGILGLLASLILIGIMLCDKGMGHLLGFFGNSCGVCTKIRDKAYALSVYLNTFIELLREAHSL